MRKYLTILITLLYVAAWGGDVCIGEELQPQFSRPPPGHGSDEEFIVKVQSQIKGPCLSYYAYSTPDQATILIPWKLLTELAAPSRSPSSEAQNRMLDRSYQARRIINSSSYSERDVWGCASLSQELGAGAYLLFDLLESGSVVVIDDSRSKPVSEIVVRYPRSNKNISSYFLSEKSKSFLTRNLEGIDFRVGLEESEPATEKRFAIDREPANESDQPFYGFLRKFISSCTSKSREAKKFYVSHIRLPFEYKFSVVSELGKSTSSQGVIKDMKMNSTTGGFGLPICIGDGGLEDVSVRKKGNTAVANLTFGSGPNEQLHFKLLNAIWMLSSAEWIDH